MSALVPVRKMDRNGKIVTRWVKSESASASKSALPAPTPLAARIPDCPEGWIDLYHRTTPEAAEAINTSGSMMSKENTQEAFFSTVAEGGQGEGYGSAVIWVRVPEDEVEIDDEFPSGEEHYRAPLSSIKKDRLLPYG